MACPSQYPGNNEPGRCYDNGLHGVVKSREITAATGVSTPTYCGGGMAVWGARMGRLAYVARVITGGIVFASTVVRAHSEAKVEARRTDEDGITQD